MPAPSSPNYHDGNNEALRLFADTAPSDSHGRGRRKQGRKSRPSAVIEYFRTMSFHLSTSEKTTRFLDVSELLPIILPFCPRRATEALSAGFYHDPLTGTINVSPTPRKKAVALLLVDVSGFTRLSEEFSKLGKEGCEEFSLVMSRFLARMCKIIHEHGGDIDCFAGDALLVAFSQSQRQNVTSNGAHGGKVEKELSDDSDSRLHLPKKLSRRRSTRTFLAEKLNDMIPSSRLSPSVRSWGGTSSSSRVRPDMSFRDEEDGAHGGKVEKELSDDSDSRLHLPKKLSRRRSTRTFLAEKLNDMIPSSRLSPSVRSWGGTSSSSRVRPDMSFRDEDCGIERCGEVTSAVACATAICQELNGFRASENHPPLGIHAALSAGTVYAVECGGSDTSRSEAFLMGEPLLDLAKAMPQSADSELVLAPSAVRSFDKHAAAEPTEPRKDGCLCIRLPQMEVQPTSRLKWRRSSSLCKPQKEKNTENASLETLLASLPEGEAGVDRIEPLMRFIPAFVRQRCLAGIHVPAENRTVSILFLVADMQAITVNEDAIRKLQLLLGNAIDIAEAGYGGSTRQITMDEKGLAAIFVFGLPGFGQHNHALMCLQSSLAILDAMHTGGMEAHAGLATGACFCGLVGDPEQRCEYAVLGDTVNTAARIAWKAHKQRRSSLCTEGFRDFCFRSSLPMRVKMYPAGSVALKGKTEEIAVYQPSVRLPDGSAISEQRHEVLVGRYKEISEVKNVIERRCCYAHSDECTMVLIQGASGSGKSAILRHVAKLASSMLPNNTMMVIQLRPAGQEQLLSTCSTLLWAMLDHMGVSGTGQDWLLESDQGTSEVDLPDMLKPFAPGLAAAQAAGPILKIKEFSNLYVHILLRLLREIQRPVVVVIDDADRLDGASMAVLASLGMQLGLSAEGRAPGIPCAIIMACKSAPSMTYKPFDTGSTESSLNPLCHLSDQRGSTLVSLSPLDKDSTAELAKTVFRCEDMSSELVNFIYGKSQGIPMYAKEMCMYMADNAMLKVDTDGVTCLRTAAELRKMCSHGSLSMASLLHNIIQSKIDKLPPRASVVLRCASVLGYCFSLNMLLEMVAAELEMHYSKEEVMNELKQALRVLAKKSFLLEDPSISSHDAKELWKFSSRDIQEAVLSSMLHRDRRELHRRAANLARAKLDEAIAEQEAAHSHSGNDYRLSRVIFSHLVAILKTESRALKRHVTLEDLRGILSSGKWLAEKCRATGRLEECMKIHDQLLKCLPPFATFPDSAMLISQLDIARCCTATYTFAEFCGFEFTELAFSDSPRMTLISEANLSIQRNLMNRGLGHYTSSSFSIGGSQHLRQTWLCSLLDNIVNRPSLSGCFPWRRKVRGMSAIAANIKLTAITAEFTPRKRLSIKSTAYLLDRCRTETRPEVKMIFAGMAGALLFSSTRWLELREHAEDAYNAFEAASRRPAPPAVVFVDPRALMMIVYGVATTLCGDIDSSVVKQRLDRDLLLVKRQQRKIVFGLFLWAESLWETAVGSGRIKNLFLAVEGESTAAKWIPNEFDTLVKPTLGPFKDMLDLVSSIAPQLHHRTCFGGYESRLEQMTGNCKMHTEPVADISSEVLSQWEEYAALATKNSRAAFGPPLGCVTIARACIDAGCRVIFPPAPCDRHGEPTMETVTTGSQEPSILMVTNAGVSHLQAASRSLSLLLEKWESKHMHHSFNCLMFPAMLLWGRAMLHWFQWRLVTAGAMKESEMEDSRMGVGVRGWDQGLALPAGLRCVCSRLLHAQVLSMSDEKYPELLTACLPATVAFARLLLGQGDVDSEPRMMPQGLDWAAEGHGVGTGLSSALMTVPCKPVIGAATDGGIVQVCHVVPGTLEAMSVACEHLRTVVSHIKINGDLLPADLGLILRKEQVGNSESIWEAVSLHHQISRELESSK